MIPETFSALPVLQQSFWYLAAFASLIFIFQTILTLLGTHSGDLSTDFDADTNHFDAPFVLFTFRNLINFLLGFGWTGVAFYGKYSDTLVVIFAAVVGIIFVAMFFFIIKQMLKLQEDNSFKIENTLGKTAQVYMNIPPHKNGIGKIQMSIKGSFHELEAVTEESETIFASEMVKVVKVENQILIVEKI
ncbi:Membrane protein implicated in regulation of membrane protease activity [Halpernia humi]|uniref:Membrane protein implicated in regulation of membrane protease activity n=1 Tax=Halpernia humi TaxID=493375 RepID=A0A1H6BIT9_9FLAO|nr:NfeD family protein [Halpernia humi]SEG60623.1 Membrane protein implicated in regulation of membrane protease activity [Halpernia humi]